jgi:CBS domain containing-hemolysin-like protein
MLSSIFIVLLLIALNAFFVAAEFAIIKVRYSAVEADAAEGRRVAKLAQSVLDRLDAYLSASQIGITLASLALGWVGEPVLAQLIMSGFTATHLPVSVELAHSIAVPVAFVTITILHLVFGEAVPKYAAIYHPLLFTYLCTVPLRFFASVTSPLVWLINAATYLVLAPFGIRVRAEHDTHTEEELRLLLAESARSGELGSIQKTEHEIIEKVFGFDERVVRQIMVPRPQMAAVNLEASVEEILDLVSREGYSRMPVYSGSKDTIVGIVHSKELLRKFMEKKTIPVSEIMRPPYFVPDTKKISSLLRELQSRKSHMAIIVDEFGVACGLVTLEDIVEELVGEIQDEFDDEKAIVEERREGGYLLNAHAAINDVNMHLPEPLPEAPDYSTVAGLMNVLFSGIPEVGQVCRDGAYEFRILKRSRGSVDSVLATLLPPEQEEDGEQA